MSDPAAEIESPTPAAPEPQLPVTKRRDVVPLLERMLTEGAGDVLDKIEQMTKALDTLRRYAIRATYPADWIIHVATGPDGSVIREVGYLQDCGAQRAGKIWGIQLTEPIVEREDFQDGTYTYTMMADAFSKVTGEQLQNVEGSRWSGDPFFKRSVGPEEKVDPSDVRKSAAANLDGRAVRQLAGLNAVPLDILESCGIDPKKVVHVSYGRGAKGGESTGASVGGSDIVIRWGNGKGKTIPEQTDKDLDFYLKAAKKDLDDPEKAKFKKNTERLIAAIATEIENRKKTKEQATETGEATPQHAKAKGQRMTELMSRLKASCKEYNMIGFADVLFAVTGKRSVSDLTEDEMAKVEGTSDDELKITAAAVADGSSDAR